MNYYVLDTMGYAWLEGTTEAPDKYKRMLTALAKLSQPDDTPQSLEQIAHFTHTPNTATAAALHYLSTEGYVRKATPPKAKPSHTPKPQAAARLRIPSIEKLVESEARRQLSQEHYFHSKKGQAALDRYWKSKGKAVREKYWKSNKGKLAQKIWRLKRRASELEVYIEGGGNGGAKENLENAKKRLKEALEERGEK